MSSVSKKKVLIISNSLGGLFSFRKEVISSIIHDGYDVVISSPHNIKEKEDFFLTLGCSFVFSEIERRGTNPLHDFTLFLNYYKLIRSVKPMVVLTYTIKPNVYGGIAARICCVPQIANITGLGDAIENPGILQKFSILLYRYGLKKTSMVFYQNGSIKQFCLRHHVGNEGVLLPGSGVNLDWHMFQEYPTEGEVMKFNFIGRVVKDKGIDEFIKMVKTIHIKYPQTEFHILGECEEHYETQLRELQKQGFLIWYGAVPDVRPFIKDSCCTIHPSYHEGMANVLLETCAAGRPVITCDVPGCREVVDDGVNGYLCKVKNAQDLIDKVEKFITLPHETKVKMGVSAREKVVQEFDRQQIIDEYLKAIKKIS